MRHNAVDKEKSDEDDSDCFYDYQSETDFGIWLKNLELKLKEDIMLDLLFGEKGQGRVLQESKGPYA